VAKGKDKSGRLSVFKGREARLNRAIFHILAHRGTLTIYDIYREVKAQKGLRRIRYASINKRVKALEQSGYIEKIGTKKTKAGFETVMYEVTARAYLAILWESISLESVITRLDEATAREIIAAIMPLL